MSRLRWAFVSLAALAVAAVTVAGAAGGKPGDENTKKLDKIQHIVVIYEENHSFDNLYGGWEGVNGRDNADAARTNQIAQNGLLYSCLLQNDVNLTSPPQPSDCTDTSTGTAFGSHFPSAPFSIEGFIPKDARTCPQPGVFAAHGLTPSAANLPGGCTEDIVHRFYQEQYQLHGGKQDLYVTGSDAVGLAMGYYDTTKLPIYTYLHGHDAPHYVIADDFFQGAFGGSFLNHQWLIAAACTAVGQHARGPARNRRLERDAERYAEQHVLPALPSDGAGERSGGDEHMCLAAGHEAGPCVRRLRRQHDPAALPAHELEPAEALAANGNDDRRRADCGARQLGLVLRRLVERRRRQGRAGLDERHGDDVYRSELVP